MHTPRITVSLCVNIDVRVCLGVCSLVCLFEYVFMSSPLKLHAYMAVLIVFVPPLASRSHSTPAHDSFFFIMMVIDDGYITEMRELIWSCSAVIKHESIPRQARIAAAH